MSPDAGETTVQQHQGYSTPSEFVIEPTADGFGVLKGVTFKAGCATDTSEEDAAFLKNS